MDPPVQGTLHVPAAPNGDSIVLTHGAGSNCNAPLLVALSESFSRAGLHALRCNLPYRQVRPTGPPFPGQAGRDRQGLRNAIKALRDPAGGRQFLGGHSYGGRQATMLAAEEPALCDALLILSYPLHPPKKPEQLRVDHLPNLSTPVFFVHGSRDPFGSIEEITRHLAVIPGRHRLEAVEGAGHDLVGRKDTGPLVERISGDFLRFTSGAIE